MWSWGLPETIRWQSSGWPRWRCWRSRRWAPSCSYAEKSLTTTIGQKVLHEMRRTLYAQIQRLSLAYRDRQQTGDLISRVTGDIDSVQSFLASGLLSTLVSLLTLFGMIGVMFYIDWQFTLIALSIVPLLFAVVFTYTRKIKKASRAVRKKEGEMASIIQEVFSAVRVVKAFAREDYEQRRYEVESMESVGIALRARGLKARLSPMVEMIVAGGTCMVLWFGARMVLDGSLSTGSLIVFVLYLGRMYKPMQELSKMTDTYTKAAVAWERIQEVLQTKRDIEDLPGAVPAPPFQGSIEFDHVAFSYGPRLPVLHDVSFRIAPGEMAALVGPTGSGKSTITSLVARFYDPTAGVVKIDGFDIRQLPAVDAAPADRLRAAGDAVVPRDHRDQYRVRQIGRDHGRDRARRGTGQCQRVHRQDAGRLRHRRG